MIYRIQVTLQNGKCLAGVGFFADVSEAQDQTWADYPEATAVIAICLRAGVSA